MTTTRNAGRPIRLRKSGLGYAAEGRGFYIWDEDPRVVMDSAAALEGGRLGSARARRVRLFPVSVRGSASSEALDA